MKIKKPIIGLILHGVILCVLFGQAAAADNPSRILILPFQIHAEKDLSFLKKGIVDMLSSHLAAEGKVELVNPGQALASGPEPATEAAAPLLGEKLNADYVAFGSLTIFGDSISTDARFIDVRLKKPVVLFNQSGKSHDDVIFHINQFADRVNADVFGRQVVASQAPRPAPPQTVDESRRNPETLFNETGGFGQDYGPGPGGERAATDFAMWRSQSFSMHIKGLAVGDVDADGNNETVFIGDDILEIYRHAGGRFQKLAEIKAETSNTFYSVDVADINENGKAEIFITAEESLSFKSASSTDKSLRSFVMEWTGKEFVKIVDKAKWYYRVIHVPKRGDILVGQQRGFDSIFTRGVDILVWENGGYEPAGKQKLPRYANVFSFTLGDVMNNGQEMTVAFDRSDYLRIIDTDGNEQWKSASALGGNRIYFEYPMENTSSRSAPLAGQMEMEHFYLSQRVLVVDFDQDGKNEVIVANNKDTMGNYLSRLRSFNSGHIECLFWDTLGLYPRWRTRTVSGYIGDYAVADFDNDGSPELVFSVDTDTNPLLKQAKSYLVTWKPKPPAQK